MILAARPLKRAAAIVSLGIVLLCASAHATEVAVGVGVDLWTAGSSSAVFSFTADPLWTLFEGLEVGARTGLFFVTPGSLGTGAAGIPLDVQIRGVVGHFYIEGLAGPWFFFTGDVVRAHVAMGFGWQTGPIRLGAEVAYLTGGAQLGARFAFAF